MAVAILASGSLPAGETLWTLDCHVCCYSSAVEKLHARVKTWTRHVDLFAKDYIILPVCDR